MMKKLLIVLLAVTTMLFLGCEASSQDEDPITYDTKIKEPTSTKTEIIHTTQAESSDLTTASTEEMTTGKPYAAEAKEPTVTVSAEVIADKNTVKVTFESSNPLSVYLSNKAYIRNYQGEYLDKGYLDHPMESPVICYVPIGYFYSVDGEFRVTKYASTEPMKYFIETVKVNANISEAFSDAPITVSDPFLDAALKAEFGEAYCERDLSQIKCVEIYYYRTTHGQFPQNPAIVFTYYDKTLGRYDNGISSYVYSDFFEEDWTGDFPKETLLDMEYFPLLESVSFRQSRSKTTPSEVPLPEGYLENILVKTYTAADFS